MRVKTICFLMLYMLVLVGCKTREADNARVVKKEVKNPVTVKVAFYNVQNLFDLQKDGKEYPEFTPGFSNWDRDMQQKKLDNISSVIKALNADVIGLCEIEDNDALDDLSESLKRNGCDYKYGVICKGSSETNTNPAVLSRYPIKNIKELPVNTGTSVITRSILEFDITANNSMLKIFVNHWPSKHHKESLRIKTAQTLMLRLNELPKGADYVIMGDFNSDYDDYQKIKTSGLDDSNGKTGLHSYLNTAYEGDNHTSRLFTEHGIINSSVISHYDLWLELPAEERMSYFYKGNRQTPDHILLSSALYDRSGFSYLDNSFNVFTWDNKLLKSNKPYSWEFYWKKKAKLHSGVGYSDHLPIYAEFVTFPFTFDSKKAQYASDTLIESSIGGFEQSSDGWMLCNSYVEMNRVSDNPKNGLHSLCIKGGVQKNNGSVARIVIDKAHRTKKGVKFYFRGSGKILFRYRSGDQKWTYFKDNKPLNNIRYENVDISDWHEAFFETAGRNEDIELEVRSGKGTPFCLWLDDFQY